jgi:predicted acyl esterase
MSAQTFHRSLAVTIAALGLSANAVLPVIAAPTVAPAKADPDFIRESIYVPVRDGTRLALNIYRPVRNGR